MFWSRRNFLGAIGTSLGTIPLVAPMLSASSSLRVEGRGKSVTPYGTARNLIFMRLTGGASHLDTFDMKAGSWTPNVMGASLLKGYMQWPVGTMPRLAERTDRFSLIRSISNVEQDHGRAIFHMSTSYQVGINNRGRIPHFGSVLSQLQAPEFEGERLLPNSLSFGRSVDEGILDPDHRLGPLDAFSGYANLSHFWADPESRFYLLAEQPLRNYASSDPRNFYRSTRKQARQMAESDSLSQLTQFDNIPEFANATEELYYRQVMMSGKLVAGNVGTRFVEVDLLDWDHHGGIYTRDDSSVVINSRAMDLAVSSLLDFLEETPGVRGGSLLDETMIVITGEFGRTPGNTNASSGRDHYPYVNCALVAGAGTGGGKIIGATNDTASSIVDAGWSTGRPVTMADLMATMYSALGIDFTGSIEVGREGIPLVGPEVSPWHIDELFGEA